MKEFPAVGSAPTSSRGDSQALRVAIFGSCVSGDAVVNSEALIDLVANFARSSMASAFASAPVAHVVLDGISSPFQRRMVTGDVVKAVATFLRQNEFDILLHDPIEERFNLLELADGSLLTRTPEFLRARDPLSGRATTVIPTASPKFLARWESGWSRFIDLLDARGLRGALRVNMVYWATRTASGASFGPILSEERVRNENEFLSILYHKMAVDLSQNQFLRYDDALMVGADIHRWGRSPFHYVDDLYQDCIRQLMANHARVER